jgi:hypothetical protein
VNTSPNITNRALSLSTNLGKPGGVQAFGAIPSGKNKQQSIQSIYSEKNQAPIMIPQNAAGKLSGSGGAATKGPLN